MLLAEVRITIVIRKMSRYLMNRAKLGSECMYHEENSMIDQVTKRATGRNIVEKKSNFRLIESLMVLIVIQCQLVIRNSVLEWNKMHRGMRLSQKVSLINEVT